MSALILQNTLGASSIKSLQLYFSANSDRYEKQYLKLAYKTLLDKAVLEVLRNRPTPFGLRAGQIVKLLLGRKLGGPNYCIPNFLKLANHVKDFLHRHEREGKAVCERTNGSKRWFIGESLEQAVSMTAITVTSLEKLEVETSG